MDKSVLFNLVKTTSLLTLCLFLIDSDEFQGDYLMAIIEFVLMLFIVSLLLTIVYSVILLFRRLVKMC